nr:MAG TPA: tail tubular protein [Caudoviricetes sp.]
MSNTKHTFHATALAAVNEALVTLGQDTTLSELSTDSTVPESRKAAYVYDGSRMRVLREHAWNFAKGVMPMAGCLATCPQHSGNERLPFVCPVPPKCARVLECLSETSGKPCEWSLFGRSILASEPVGGVVYVRDVEDLERWSPDAYRALVLRLAADLAKPITGRINERQLQEQAYADALAQAKLSDARESNVPQDPWDDNPYADAMRGRRPSVGRCGRPEFGGV